MMPGSLARRYARALLGLATSPQQRDRFAADLAAADELMDEEDEAGTPVLTVLTTERHPLSKRQAILSALLQRIDVDPTVGKFLTLVLERGRLAGIGEINRAYRRFADDAAGRVHASITSAQPLPSDAVQRLTQALERATGKTVITETDVDPELIGGVVTRVDSYVLDGSVRAALHNLRRTLHL